MNEVNYKLRIKGLQTPKGTISIRALRDVLEIISEGSERGLRLAVQGESIKRGKPPAWLSKSVNFTITGIEDGSTVIDFAAPQLGQTAADQIRDQDLWYTKPLPHDTAITLFCRSVNDTTAEDLESDTYDAGVLEGLMAFQPFLKSFAQCVELESADRPTEQFHISTDEIEKVRRLKASTPEPRALVLAGELDTIEHSRRRFLLRLSDGQTIPGTIDPEFLDVESMRQWWGSTVTIKGLVHFRPSRKVRLLEAQVIKPMAAGEEVFDHLPESLTTIEMFEDLRRQAPSGSPLTEVWGQWPGDESIEEILAALKQ